MNEPHDIIDVYYYLDMLHVHLTFDLDHRSKICRCMVWTWVEVH